MMTPRQRLSFLGIAAAIAVVAIVVFAMGSGPDETAEDAASPAAEQTATPTATSTAGDGGGSTPEPTASPRPQPPLLTAGRVRELRVTEGETVRFRVRSSAAEEIHVHGYNLTKAVPAGRTTAMSFRATITGIFEIELHGAHEQIAELRVEPD